MMKSTKIVVAAFVAAICSTYSVVPMESEFEDDDVFPMAYTCVEEDFDFLFKGLSCQKNQRDGNVAGFPKSQKRVRQEPINHDLALRRQGRFEMQLDAIAKNLYFIHSKCGYDITRSLHELHTMLIQLVDTVLKKSDESKKNYLKLQGGETRVTILHLLIGLQRFDLMEQLFKACFEEIFTSVYAQDFVRGILSVRLPSFSDTMWHNFQDTIENVVQLAAKCHKTLMITWYPD